ncbi:MAG: DUF1905 domain-containing protein [Nocardioidaceae bacterium]|nr:DUF1905 domain-containing protein [Nocardioidaceae bacterium]MCL2612899.1 DUF1905 domain-containing protein [Nocardioidaceae bacterium]
MDLAFDAEVIEWRGPAPFYYAVVPEQAAEDIADLARELTYGWGCIPVTARIGETRWTTSLFPKDGGYLVPLKVAVRRAEGVDLGDVVGVRLTLGG